MLSAEEDNLLCRVECGAAMRLIVWRHRGVVLKTEDWRMLGVSPGELAFTPISRAAE